MLESRSQLLLVGIVITVLGAPPTAAQPPATQSQSTAAALTTPTYVLGPDDVIAIRALDAEEIGSGSIRIDPSGIISLPLVGRVSAGGLTVEALEKELSNRLKIYVREPAVSVTVVEYRSQPVSVIGAVGQAGVQQLEGRKTLIEVLAKAGGLRPEAGNVVKLTRRAEWGKIPVPSATMDPTGQYSVAEISLSGIIQATSPEDNVLIMPNDVLSVPRANLVYVIGEVRRPGGFVLQERKAISGLHALAMAEGLNGEAAADRAMIIRQSATGRVEIAANLKDILRGKTQDVELLPDDILFVPTSGVKSALRSTLQTALTAITSTTIYRGF